MKTVVALLLVCPLAVLGQTKHLLSLRDALQMGLERSTALRISASRVDVARARAGEAGATMLPTLKVEGSYKRLSDVDPFQIAVPFLPAPIEVAPTVLDNYAFRATLQQPLFTGFRLQRAAESADFLADAADADTRGDTFDLMINIISAYWTLYQLRETEKYVDENAGRLETYRRDTENLMRAGMATRNDLLKIEVQLSTARLSQIDAANDVQVALMSLNNVIGQPLDTEVELGSVPGESDSLSASIGSLPFASLVERTFSSRPDIRAMESRVEAAEAGVAAAQGSWWPQVFLSGNYYYSRPNVRYQPTRDEFKSTWDVGVTLQLDIWNWGTTAYQTDQARAALAMNQNALKQLKDNVSVEVQRHLLSFQRAGEKVSVAGLAVQQAEENLRITDDKFKNGLATSSELLDADVALLQSRNNLTSAHIERELSQARLQRALGILPRR